MELQQRPTRPPVSSPRVAAKRLFAEKGDLQSTAMLICILTVAEPSGPQLSPVVRAAAATPASW